MDGRRARGHRFADAAHRFKLFIIDLNEFFRLRENCFALRDYEANSVADTAGNAPFGDHHVPVLLDVAYFIVGDVLGREHGEHAGKRQRLRSVYIKHARARIS